MEQGWIKLYRKIEDNDFLMTDNTAYILFTKLLFFANREGGWYRAATRSLAQRANLPHSTTYKALKRLQDEGLITVEVHDLYSKIFISNWTVYQSNKEIDSILEHNVPLGGKRSTKRIITDGKKKPGNAKVNTNETLTKRRGNADETYNKKKNKEIELEVITNVIETDVSKAVYGKPEINEMFEYWESVVGYRISSRIKMNRNACSALLKQMTTDEVKRIIQGVALAHEDRFSPNKFSDFIGVRSNLNDLLAWGRKNHKAESKVFRI